MITLPTSAQRHWVSAFAWTATVLLLLAGAAVGWGWAMGGIGTSLPVFVLVGAGVGMAVAGLLFGNRGRRLGVYRIWARLSRRVSDLVAAYVTRLLFAVVTVSGLGGSRFQLEAPPGDRSNWTPKSPVPAEAYESQHVGRGDGRGGWSGSYVSWALASALWALVLYPLIALLGFVQTREKGSFGGNVYTLY